VITTADPRLIDLPSTRPNFSYAVSARHASRIC
jgi:hypothetical protein